MADNDASSATSAHAYASNGLEVLQAATDAAAALAQNQDASHLHPIDAPAPDAEAVAPPPPNSSLNYPNVDGGGNASDTDAVTAGLLANDAAAAVVAAAASSQAQPSNLAGGVVHHSLPMYPMPPPPPVASGNVMRDPTINPKLTRLRRACDMCSKRKVKCDEAGPPCKPCSDLNVDCTFSRELKRRGPPNKHAEAARAAKRSRLDPNGTAAGIPYGPGSNTSSNGLPPPSASPHNAAETLVSIAGHDDARPIDAESIVPLAILEQLVDDYFAYVYPVTPFPHEPTFRAALERREDRTNPEFMALLASMMALLVASFPRTVREHLKAEHSPQLFPQAIVMVEKCHEIVLQARGSRWPLKQPNSLDDALTSYFMSLAMSYTMQSDVARKYAAETLTLINGLGASGQKHVGMLPTFGGDSSGADGLSFDHVKDQVGKRLFWSLLLDVRSKTQMATGISTSIIIPPSTPVSPYPDLPDNVEDELITPQQVLFLPDAGTTLLASFRLAINVYTTMNGIASVDIAYGLDSLPWSDQRTLLRDAMLAARDIALTLPPELQLKSPEDESRAFGEVGGTDKGGVAVPYEYVPPGGAFVPHDIRGTLLDPARRRMLQFDLQRVSLYVSLLCTRTYFVELYLNQRDLHVAAKAEPVAEEGSEEAAEEERTLRLMAEERELVVQSLLLLVAGLSRRSLEPNAAMLLPRLRHVASLLLNDAPERKGAFAVRNEEALAGLLDVLMSLERATAAGEGSIGAGMMNPEAELAEAGAWEALAVFRRKYADAGELAFV